MSENEPASVMPWSELQLTRTLEEARDVLKQIDAASRSYGDTNIRDEALIPRRHISIGERLRRLRQNPHLLRNEFREVFWPNPTAFPVSTLSIRYGLEVGGGDSKGMNYSYGVAVAEFGERNIHIFVTQPWGWEDNTYRIGRLMPGGEDMLRQGRILEPLNFAMENIRRAPDLRFPDQYNNGIRRVYRSSPDSPLVQNLEGWACLVRF